MQKPVVDQRRRRYRAQYGDPHHQQLESLLESQLVSFGNRVIKTRTHIISRYRSRLRIGQIGTFSGADLMERAGDVQSRDEREHRHERRKVLRTNDAVRYQQPLRRRRRRSADGAHLSSEKTHNQRCR